MTCFWNNLSHTGNKVTLLMICASYGALLFSLIIMYWIYDSGGFEHASERTISFCFYLVVILPFVTSEESLKALFGEEERIRIDSSRWNLTMAACMLVSIHPSVHALQ